MSKTKTIIIANNKGGVGKTSCTAAIADVLATQMGYDVLVIDADPQGSLSKKFGYDPETVRVNNTFELYIEQEIRVRSGKSNAPLPINVFYNPAKRRGKLGDRYSNLSIICSNRDLESTYSLYRTDPYADGIMRDMLISISESEKFDYVLIDTQPNLSHVLGQYLLGSDFLLIPVTPYKDAVDGAYGLGMAYNAARKQKDQFRIYNRIELIGIFFNMVKGGTRATKEFIPQIIENWGENPVLNARIPMNQDVNNAGNAGAPVTAIKKSSKAAIALAELTKEVVAKTDAYFAECDGKYHGTEG